MQRETLELEARRAGFSKVRIAEAPSPRDFHRYDTFLDRGFAGEMTWLAETRDVRADVRRLLPEARSVVVLAMDYGRPAPPDPGGLTGRVASYAWGRDYHNLIGLRLRDLRRRLEAIHPGLRAWGGVDSGPAWERGWAAAAGLGFTGRNMMQIVPADGSTFFLAVMLLSEALAPDAPVEEHCGRCRRCLDACPTAALLEDGGMDARRCVSYLTIEHRGSIPVALRPRLGRWIFGCDDCQTACPHVRLPDRPLPADFAPRHAWLPLPAVLLASDEALRDTFEGTPLRRAIGTRLRRNACVALGNIGDPAARPALEVAWRSDDEIVAEHAGWALDLLRA
ncbi:MAG: tRNA epoxyqueuosine(34) reductase QueG [Myxococcota bacterium]